MKLNKGSKAVVFLALVSLVLFLFMLYFRAAIYSDMYIAPGDPYGVSDIIEFILGCIFLLLSVVSGIVSVVIFFRGTYQSKLFSVGLILLHAGLYLSFGVLHTLAANYAAT